MFTDSGTIKARNVIHPEGNKERSARNENSHSLIGESEAGISVSGIAGPIQGENNPERAVLKRLVAVRNLVGAG